MYKPRDYQQEAYDAGITHARTSEEPAILELGTAAGKSIIIAMLAQTVKKSGKRVLVLCPNSDLCTQNVEKFRAIGEQCSIYSAKLNSKNTGHKVVFATPISVANNLEDFDESYALIIVDEAHTVGEDDESSYQKIFSYLKNRNKKIRLIGLTATPVRGKTKLVSDESTFNHVAYSMPSCELSKRGWTVPPVLGVSRDEYHLAEVKIQSNGRFKQSDIDEHTLEKERITRHICNETIRIMDEQGRNAAMFFASSLRHAAEIVSYLPPGDTAFIDGFTLEKDRTRILEETREGKWRYLVNVATLTTGTDVTIIDTIVLCRATHSIGLLLQILGRACRLHCPGFDKSLGQMNWLHQSYDGKKDYLVLDFGGNIDRFSLDDDLTITGLVSAKNKQDDDEYFAIECPDCKTENRHTAQRCIGIDSNGDRCKYRFIFKDCQECGAKNSPSARHCSECSATLIDPEKNLTRNPAIGAGLAFQVAVMSMTLRQHFKGESESLRVEYSVTDGERTYEVNEFLKPSMWSWKKWSQQTGCIATTVELAVESARALTMPTRLMIKKKKQSKYFEIVNRYVDTPIDRNNQLDQTKAA